MASGKILAAMRNLIHPRLTQIVIAWAPIPLPIKVEPIVIPQQLHTLPLPTAHPHAEGGRVVAGDFRSYVIEGVGVAVVLEGAGFNPAIAQHPVGGIPNPGRGFHLGVEVAVVEGAGVGRNPPETGADLFVGGVQGDGAASLRASTSTSPTRSNAPVDPEGDGEVLRHRQQARRRCDAANGR